MKQKTKHLSKATMSVVLALVLIVSTVAVGIIATNAAYVNGSPKPSANTANAADDKSSGSKAGDAVGAKADDSVGATYYLLLDKGSNKPSDLTRYVTSSSKTFTVTPSSFGDSGSTFSTGQNYFVAISSGTSYTNMYSQGSGTSAVGTVTGSGLSANTQQYNLDGTNYHFAMFYVTSSSISSVTVSVSGGDNTTYNFSAATSSYTISYGSTTNGSLPSTPTSATSGSTVQFAVTPATGYQVATVTYTPSGGSATACTLVSGTTYKFTMPSKNVTVNATFSQVNYTITKSASNCTITADSTATYNSTVNFTVAPDTDYALKSVTVKQGSTNISTTSTGTNAYRFTMPAGNVTITATCATTVGLVSFKFKSATAWVYHPFISINGGAEVEMTLGETPDYLDQGTTTKKVKPYSQTGSLRYAWYTADLTGIDTSKPVTVTVRGQDTYMEATGTFTLEAGSEVWLACDNLMEGSDLVNVTSLAPAARDFYDTPLNMIDD